MMQAKYAFLVGVGLAAAATAVQAGSLRFTIEAPGIQSFQGTAPDVVEDFDGFTSGSAFPPGGSVDTSVGRYIGGTPDAGGSRTTPAAGEFGGADGSGNYLQSTNAGYTLDFLAAGPAEPVGYFGFWWSAGDGENQLTVNMADGSSRVFVTQGILDSPSLQGAPGVFTDPPDGHFGNPNGPFGVDDSYNTGEPYAFVNIYAQNAASKITNIVFAELGPSGFETDNHTIVVDLIDGNNQGGSEIPLPATALLLGAGIGLIGWTRRRRRS
ncbi:VPLPA-CTERM sorting domain-containing protein [uncultured Thiohalocapsa sp.]|uniref:VPLPA-CTERM sorting domain-containing protein n=1 Tax=uncultured Thiohalocapsa sp. TaxID=768990 RepID=UPI0025CDC3C3|nr:VPLPA-CTERM sorting domain-containing protein [uncultured Thiohalocapsa sp.]